MTIALIIIPTVGSLLAVLYRAAPDSPYHDRRK